MVGEKRITQLPLNGRDWTQLATLEPGVASIRSENSVGNRVQQGEGQQMSISGGRPWQNNYRLGMGSASTIMPTGLLAALWGPISASTLSKSSLSSPAGTRPSMEDRLEVLSMPSRGRVRTLFMATFTNSSGIALPTHVNSSTGQKSLSLNAISLADP